MNIIIIGILEIDNVDISDLVVNKGFVVFIK